VWGWLCELLIDGSEQFVVLYKFVDFDLEAFLFMSEVGDFGVVVDVGMDFCLLKYIFKFISLHCESIITHIYSLLIQNIATFQ
jgi:hypothetical protein